MRNLRPLMEKYDGKSPYTKTKQNKQYKINKHDAQLRSPFAAIGMVTYESNLERVVSRLRCNKNAKRDEAPPPLSQLSHLENLYQIRKIYTSFELDL